MGLVNVFISKSDIVYVGGRMVWNGRMGDLGGVFLVFYGEEDVERKNFMVCLNEFYIF